MRGYRSGLEDTIARQIDEAGFVVLYESEKLSFTWPERSATYTPDFLITKHDGNVMYIETKGRFVVEDRQKMLLVREQNPDLDIRLVFQTATRNSTKTAKRHMRCGAQSTTFHMPISASLKSGLRKELQMAKQSQTAKILEHLNSVGSISFLEAWDLYRVRSLPRRIADLREKGWQIRSDKRKDHLGQRYVRYSLAQ